MSTSLVKLNKEKKKLHQLVKQSEEERKKRVKGQTVPDLSNNLTAYFALPGAKTTVEGKEKDYGSGWSYKTRRTSVGPLESSQILSYEQEDHTETKVFRVTNADVERVEQNERKQRRRSSMRQTSRARSVSPKLDTIHDGTEKHHFDDDYSDIDRNKTADNSSVPRAQRLAVWCKENQRALTDNCTVADKKMTGKMKVSKLKELMIEIGCALFEEEENKDEKDTEDTEPLIDENDADLIDYSKWISKQCMTATRYEVQSKRRSSTAVIGIHLPSAPKEAPSVVPFTQLAKVRKQVEDEKNKTKHKKSNDEFDRTVTQLEQTAFYKVKSKKSRKQLENAYLLYSNDKGRTRKALEQAKQKAKEHKKKETEKRKKRKEKANSK
eukprot:m.33231 g.33231  ORF g.33231 m.33231 type:complete len:381 (+) comp9847_c0_seq1:166-1308(+)